MAPYAGVDQTEGREVLLRCRQSLANQAEGQQILCVRRHERKSPLAHRPKGYTLRERCSQHRDNANLQPVALRPDCGDDDEGFIIGHKKNDYDKQTNNKTLQRERARTARKVFWQSRT